MDAVDAVVDDGETEDVAVDEGRVRERSDAMTENAVVRIDGDRRETIAGRRRRRAEDGIDETTVEATDGDRRRRGKIAGMIGGDRRRREMILGVIGGDRRRRGNITIRGVAGRRGTITTHEAGTTTIDTLAARRGSITMIEDENHLVIADITRRAHRREDRLGSTTTTEDRREETRTIRVDRREMIDGTNHT